VYPVAAEYPYFFDMNIVGARVVISQSQFSSRVPGLSTGPILSDPSSSGVLSIYKSQS